MKSLGHSSLPYALGLGRSKQLEACASLADVSALYRRACDARLERTGRGASGMPEGLVYDTTGGSPRPVARVSWNGRVWGPKPWAPGDEPLYDPSAVGGAR